MLRVFTRRAAPAAAVVAIAALAFLAAACGGSSSSASTPAASQASPTTSGATLASYVANVCKATATLETAATPLGGRQADPSATPDGTPADPATRAAGLVTAANAYLAALKADNPPADLADYNSQLVNEVQAAITDLGNGNFGGSGARGGANGTPFARPSGVPGNNPNPSRTPFARPSGTPGAGFPGGRGAAGGGVARLFLRNLPTPPAADAAQMDQLAASNADCQSAGFSFAPN